MVVAHFDKAVEKQEAAELHAAIKVVPDQLVQVAVELLVPVAVVVVQQVEVAVEVVVLLGQGLVVMVLLGLLDWVVHGLHAVVHLA